MTNIERIINNKIIRDANGLFVCPFCQRSFRALAYHTRQVHGVTGKELRKMFNLPLNFSLQTEDLKELRKQKALENNMDQQLIKVGQETRFKKGNKQNPDIIKNISRGHMKKIRKFEDKRGGE